MRGICIELPSVANTTILLIPHGVRYFVVRFVFWGPGLCVIKTVLELKSVDQAGLEPEICLPPSQGAG